MFEFKLKKYLIYMVLVGTVEPVWAMNSESPNAENNQLTPINAPSRNTFAQRARQTVGGIGGATRQLATETYNHVRDTGAQAANDVWTQGREHVNERLTAMINDAGEQVLGVATGAFDMMADNAQEWMADGIQNISEQIGLEQDEEGEAPVEEAPVEEASVEEAPVEEASVERLQSASVRSNTRTVCAHRSPLPVPSNTVTHPRNVNTHQQLRVGATILGQRLNVTCARTQNECDKLKSFIISKQVELQKKIRSNASYWTMVPRWYLFTLRPYTEEEKQRFREELEFYKTKEYEIIDRIILFETRGIIDAEARTATQQRGSLRRQKSDIEKLRSLKDKINNITGNLQSKANQRQISVTEKENLKQRIEIQNEVVSRLHGLIARNNDVEVKKELQVWQKNWSDLDTHMDETKVNDMWSIIHNDQNNKSEKERLLAVVEEQQGSPESVFEYCKFLIKISGDQPYNEEIISVLKKLSQDGHELAARCLYKHYVNKEHVLTSPSSVFYDLYNISIPDRSYIFNEAERYNLLSHALAKKCRSALKHVKDVVLNDITRLQQEGLNGIKIEHEYENLPLYSHVILSLNSEEPELQKFFSDLRLDVRTLYTTEGSALRRCNSLDVHIPLSPRSQDARERSNQYFIEQRQKKYQEDLQEERLAIQEKCRQQTEDALNIKHEEQKRNLLEEQVQLHTQIEDLENNLCILQAKERQSEDKLLQCEKDLSDLLDSSQQKDTQICEQQKKLEEETRNRIARTKSSELKNEVIARLQKQLAVFQTMGAQVPVVSKMHADEQDALTDLTHAEQQNALKALQESLGSIGHPGKPGFGVSTFPRKSLLEGFEPLDGYDNPHSPSYGNYEHSTAGTHVAIAPFCTRFGDRCSSELKEKYGQHAVEVKSLKDLIRPDDTLESLWRRYVDKKENGWELHRVFINAGKIQAGVLVQKYLASYDNADGYVTSKPGAIPLSLGSNAEDTRSSFIIGGCEGNLKDAYYLAKLNQEGQRHQVASVFLYSALTQLQLAQAQGCDSQEFCDWYEPQDVYNFPKGCNSMLHNATDQSLQWERAENNALGKPLTGSCKHNDQSSAHDTHNGQLCGLHDLAASMQEVVGAVTTATNDKKPTKLYVLKPSEDYLSIDATQAFGNRNLLDVKFEKVAFAPDAQKRFMLGTENMPVSLYSQASAYNALSLIPYKTNNNSMDDAEAWSGYGSVRYDDSLMNDGSVMLATGSWNTGSSAGICAREFVCHDADFLDEVGFRLFTYLDTFDDLCAQ